MVRTNSITCPPTLATTRSWRRAPLRALSCGALATLAAGFVAMPAVAEQNASVSTFAPHRAVYEITLDKSGSGSGVSELTGRMVYELNGSACEGWTQNMRFVTRSSNAEGAAQINDLRTSSWEDAAGTKLRFDVSQYRDDTLVEASQGDASKTSSGIAVDLMKPERKKLDLKGDIYFPIRHSMALLAAARSGKSSLTADLYDGAEKGTKVNHTNTVIGKAYAPGSVKSPVTLKNGDKLDAFASWPFAISYFDGGAKASDTAPSYELSFRFYENGVSTKLHIDYGEFSINGELKELTFLDASKCAPEPGRH